MSKNNPNIDKPHSNGEDIIAKINFETLSEDAPVMLWLSDTTGQNVFSNSRWRSFVGENKLKKSGKDAWLHALHPEDRDKCFKIYKDSFDKHSPFEMEYRLKRHDGEWRYILDCGEPYIGDDGKFAGYIGSSTDITERKLHEEKLKESNQKMVLHNKEMSFINKLNSYLQVCRTMDETYPVISYYMAKLFPTCGGKLYLFNENKSVVESVASWGELTVDSSDIINPDDCWALRLGKPHITHQGDDVMTCKHLQGVAKNGYISTPIHAQGEMQGFLHIQFSEKANYVSEQDKYKIEESLLRLVNVTADNLALSIMSLKLREELEAQSIRDPLTSLYNRRYMEDNLQREISKSARHKTKLGMMVLDIDHFKSINDNFGHDMGDVVIKETGEIISSHFRDSDIVCRYGGEEFVVIMLEVDEDIAMQRAEQVRLAVENLAVNQGNICLKDFTISIGVALLPDHANSGATLFMAADSAMYQSKHQGRNKVSYAKHQESPDDVHLKSA